MGVYSLSNTSPNICPIRNKGSQQNKKTNYLSAMEGSASEEHNLTAQEKKALKKAQKEEKQSNEKER